MLKIQYYKLLEHSHAFSIIIKYLYSRDLYLKWSYGGPHDGDWNIVWELHYCCYQSTEVLDICGEDREESGLVDKS